MQQTLFPSTKPAPEGFIYRSHFLSPSEEQELLGYLEDLPLEPALGNGMYFGKRRYMNFGWSYDFTHGKLIEGPPLPHWLAPCARKIAKWLDIPKDRVVEALVQEYPVGAAIGWHRDNESFDKIIGISLSGSCRLRLRPIRSRIRGPRSRKEVFAHALEPRSAYVMQDAARWDYQHSIAATKEVRYSITFRTLP